MNLQVGLLGRHFNICPKVSPLPFPQRLTAELQLLVLSYLPYPDLQTLSHASRYVRQICQDKSLHNSLCPPHTGRLTNTLLSAFLSKLAKPELTHLDLSSVFWITQSGVLPAVMGCKDIKILIFDRRVVFKMKNVFDILERLTKLVELRLTLDAKADAIPSYVTLYYHLVAGPLPNLPIS